MLSVTMLTPVNIMAAENQDSIVYTEQGETVPLKKRRQTTEMESILVDTFISKISLPMQPVPEIGSISVA